MNRFLVFWAEDAYDESLELLAEDVKYKDNALPTWAPNSGTFLGRDAVREAMRQSSEHWDYVARRLGPLRPHRADPTRFHCQIEHAARHRASGEMLFYKNRMVAKIKGERIAEIKLFHDVAQFQAFLGLIRSTSMALNTKSPNKAGCSGAKTSVAS
ncbi:MAG: nuclear transport factor 2 family protein [Hyphomicrobiaceae bacterium]